MKKEKGRPAPDSARGPFLATLAVFGLFAISPIRGLCGRSGPGIPDPDEPAYGSGPIPMVCDVHQYEADSGMTALEVVYALDVLRAECPGAWSTGRAVLSIGFRFADVSGRTLVETRSRKVLTLSEADRKADRLTFMDLERFARPPDSVLFTVWVEDSASGRIGTSERSVRIRSFGEEFGLSDLVFISRPQKGGGGHSVFEKHGVFLLPNPSRLYDASGDSSAAWVYYEINHLPIFSQESPFYSIHIEIEDGEGAVVRSQDRGPIRAGAASTSRLEKVLLGGLPAGSYTMAVTVLETSSGQSKTARRKFWVKGSAGDPGVVENAEDKEKIRRLVWLIATSEEKKIFASLTDQGLQEFLIRFWKRRDPDPRNRENEFMIEHLRRFSWAENRIVGGAESDMGRVYIVYGPPIDIQREASKTEYSKPVEIWTYGIEGTVEFVFVDRLGDGHYRLVHSTHKDEFSNPDWAADYRQ